jgi:hypothetical protein
MQIEQLPRRGPFGPSARVDHGAWRCKEVTGAGASESAQVGARIPSKLVMRVRFSSPALSGVPSQGSFCHAAMRLEKSALGPGHNVGPYFLGYRPAI